jgi:hypothetical protein
MCFFEFQYADGRSNGAPEHGSKSAADRDAVAQTDLYRGSGADDEPAAVGRSSFRRQRRGHPGATRRWAI